MNKLTRERIGPCTFVQNIFFLKDLGVRQYIYTCLLKRLDISMVLYHQIARPFGGTMLYYLSTQKTVLVVMFRNNKHYDNSGPF